MIEKIAKALKWVISEVLFAQIIIDLCYFLFRSMKTSHVPSILVRRPYTLYATQNTTHQNQRQTAITAIPRRQHHQHLTSMSS